MKLKSLDKNFLSLQTNFIIIEERIPVVKLEMTRRHDG